MHCVTTDDTPLLDHLQRLFEDSSRTTLRKLLHNSRVRVNGAIEKDGRRLLRPSDVVVVARKAVQENLNPALALLYEDADLIVVAKEEGLLTVASLGEREATAQAYLNRYLRSQGGHSRIQVVHRLDRDTSGVLVFPRTFPAKEKLKQQFALHTIERIYVAIVEGKLVKDSGTMQSFLDDEKPKVRIISNPVKGKLATTHYTTVRRTAKYSMAEVRLETGKRNQIRVQFAELGHPVIGDHLYGSGTDPLGRLGLHARTLGFTHPTTGKKMSFTAPLPEAFTKLME